MQTRLNNKLRRETDKAKASWWHQQCDEPEELANQGKQDQLYRRISGLNKRRSNICVAIKDKDGRLRC